MALYTENDFNDISADWERMRQRELQKAQEEYNARIAQSQKQNQQKQDNGGGGLGSILSGIGQTIGNLGKGLGDFFTTGAISAYGATGLKSLLEGKDYMQANREANADVEDFKKRYYNTDSVKDAYMKSAGTALDAASTLSDFIPGVGAGKKVALNIAQGATSGIAQNLIDNGENATIEDSLKGALIGAAGSTAGQIAGNRLANRAVSKPATTGLGKALQSNLGRAAATGAASGAVGGGLATALNGGDLGQTLTGALQGAGSGAASGAAMGTIYGLAGNVADNLNNKILGTSNVVEAPMANNAVPEGTLRRQTATGWNDESLSGQAKKQNYLQKLGGDLQNAAQSTKDSAIYGKLKGNTAQEMINKDAINNLRNRYGYAPDDYEQASKLSTAVNKWYDNEIQSSGASKVNTELTNNLALPSNNTLPEKYEKAYRETIKNALNMANANDSNVIDKYTAGGLERAAKYLGEQEQNMRRTNMNGVDGRVDGDRAELANYYANARKMLRNEVNSMIDLDDITKSNLAKMLDDAGATEQAKNAILSASNFAEVKSATSPLEDARTMYRQMQSSGLKRGANADNSTNLTTQIANKTGAGNLLDVALKPVRSIASGVENKAGQFVSSVGNSIAGENGGLTGKTLGKVSGLVSDANKGLGVTDADYGFSKNAADNLPLSVGDIANRQIARQVANDRAQEVRNNAYNTQAQQNLMDAQNAAEAEYAMAINSLQQPSVQQQQLNEQAAYAQNQLDILSSAMNAALAAGDVTAYGQLADLYQQAYKIYGSQIEAAQASSNPYANLNSTQVENINKLENAGNAIDELEQLFEKAGGGQGLIGGNAANFMAALGLNSDVATYNSLSRGLVNQISAAIGKTDSLNTEGEVNRALELIPKFTDDAQTAKNKLTQLRNMLANTQQTAYKNYGIAQ